jgi:endonuclease-3 related protein
MQRKTKSVSVSSAPSASSAASAVHVASLRDMARRLQKAFGPQRWWPADTPFEVMVGAVLTQNANWKNVEQAIANLKQARALSPGRILALTPAKLQRLIRPAGYFRVKEKRLRSLVEWFRTRARGRPARLKATSTEELREELLSVHGVGPETADSILLYALGRPVFVVDAYTRRVLERHGLLRGREPYDLIREAFERAITGRNRTRRMNELHAQVVELAKRHCRTRRSCEGCPLERWPKGGKTPWKRSP